MVTRLTRKWWLLALRGMVAVLFGLTTLVAAGGALASPGAVAPVLSLQTKSFAVLGGSAVTNSGASSVTGDLGVSPTNAVSGFPPGIVTGTIHYADVAAGLAQTDVITAYNDLVSQACDTTFTPPTDVGGMTLTPGVYCFGSSAGLTGILTLNAQGDPNAVWVFKIGSTLTTAAGASVLMINGGKSCNVFWQVGSSATLGTGTAFAGNILALTDITLNTGASMFGAALARNGAVTMDTNTISKCFGPNAIAIREFQATSAAGSPSWLVAGAALLLAVGLIVIRRRVLATPSAIPSEKGRRPGQVIRVPRRQAKQLPSYSAIRLPLIVGWALSLYSSVETRTTSSAGGGRADGLSTLAPILDISGDRKENHV
jgi:hypothetical protein